MTNGLDDLVAEILASKKYRRIARETVRRLGAAELAKRRGFKAGVKATKRKLHQIYGAFDEQPPYDRLYAALESAYAMGDPAAIEAACIDVLGWHASTRERIAILDTFYQRIFAVTGQPATLLDLACGLNPLTLPWMQLPQDAAYYAGDIDQALVDFINTYFALAGLPQLADTYDLLTHVPSVSADVSLLLKTVPTLERQQSGSTLQVIDAVEAPCVVVSFPVRSLGGRKKGMIRTYDQQIRCILAQRSWASERLLFDTELVYVIEK